MRFNVSWMFVIWLSTEMIRFQRRRISGGANRRTSSSFIPSVFAQ